MIIKRSFLTDFETVCLAQWFINVDANASISARTVILTPAPVDEVPLG